MSEQASIQIKNEPQPVKSKKRWLIPIICVGSALLLLCAGLIFLFTRPTDPKEKAVIAFCQELQSGNYQGAYDGFLSDALKNDVPFEKFKENFSGFSFVNDMGNRQTTQDGEILKMNINGRADGTPVRTLVAAKKFDTDNRFDQIIIIEVSNAAYAEKMDQFTAPAGKYILSVSFNSNVDPMTDTIDPDIFIEKNGERIAQAGVLSKMTFDSGKKQYQAYFTIPRDALGPELTFAYWGQDLPLRELIKQAK